MSSPFNLQTVRITSLAVFCGGVVTLCSQSGKVGIAAGLMLAGVYDLVIRGHDGDEANRYFHPDAGAHLRSLPLWVVACLLGFSLGLTYLPKRTLWKPHRSPMMRRGDEGQEQFRTEHRSRAGYSNSVVLVTSPVRAE